MGNLMNFIQILLDIGLLFMCCEAIFQEKADRAVRDILLLPLFFLVCVWARVNVIAGGQATVFLLSKGYEIAPANNLILLLVLILFILLINSLYYRPVDNGYTFCGTMTVFCIYLLTRTLSVTILSLCCTNGPFFLLGIRVLSLVLAVFFIGSPALDWIRQTIKNGGFVIRLVSANFTGGLITILSVLSFDMSSFIENRWRIAAVLLALLLFNSVLLYYNQHRMQEQKRIHMIEQYVPIVEELITQVRARQHEFHNRIFAIQGAVYCAESLEEAIQSVMVLTEGIAIQANDHELLTCDSKIIAGMLYGKIKQAEFSEVKLQIELHGFFKKSTMPETEWIELLGILLDNALEASCGGDTIYLNSRQIDHYLELTVSNPNAPMSNSEFIKLFKKGVTTKKDKSSHGYGLYHLRRITEHYHGKILTRNEQRSKKSYVVFGVLIP